MMPPIRPVVCIRQCLVEQLQFRRRVLAIQMSEVLTERKARGSIAVMSKKHRGHVDEGQLPFSKTADGICLVVRLTPRSSRSGIDGVVVDVEGRPILQLRVAAPPVDGAANSALTSFVAKSLGIRKSGVLIASGERSRVKRLDLAGDPDVLEAKIAAWIASAGVNK